jgi:hypothetical protein
MFDIKPRDTFSLSEKLMYNLWQEIKLFNSKTPMEAIKEETEKLESKNSVKQEIKKPVTPPKKSKKKG